MPTKVLGKEIGQIGFGLLGKSSPPTVEVLLMEKWG